MEKELKIAELASIWGVSVPTTGNRIKKNELKTLIKKDENNKEVNYVSISEEKLNKYIIKVKNNGNNGYYEDMLNVDNDDNNIIDAEYSKQDNNLKHNPMMELFNGLKEVYEVHNEHLQRLSNELITYKSRVPLLEDRQGLYLQQIKDIEEENKRLKKDNKGYLILLITVIILSVFMIAALSVAVVYYYKKPPKIVETEKVVTVEKPVIKYVRR